MNYFYSGSFELSVHCIAMWCLSVGKPFCKILLDLLHIFALGEKHLFHQNTGTLRDKDISTLTSAFNTMFLLILVNTFRSAGVKYDFVRP